jgi:hypothetical protein
MELIQQEDHSKDRSRAVEVDVVVRLFQQKLTESVRCAFTLSESVSSGDASRGEEALDLNAIQTGVSQPAVIECKQAGHMH